jgi:hypothetical protein
VFGVRKALVGYKLFFEEDQNPPSPPGIVSKIEFLGGT